MKKIAKSNFGQLWRLIDQNYELFAPIEKEGKVDFGLWQDGEQVNLELTKTKVSPKGFIFPQSETYLKFKTQGKKLSMEVVSGKTDEYVLFGVRPCDAVSFTLLDNVFLKEPVDKFYQERRNKGIIVSLACNNPEETCFCSSFGIEAHVPQKGADVAAWDMGETILWQPQTEKGQMLTDKLADILEIATEQDQAELKKLQESIQGKVDELPLASVDPKKMSGELKELFDAESWEELSKRCLGCGSCTYVCPTCHCYDIQDFDGGKCGERFRCWDSCMFSDFTLMAHGNPRTTQKERFRQRFMHKLVYYPNNNEGAFACVGCGRCIERCPVNMDIVKVINRIGGKR